MQNGTSGAKTAGDVVIGVYSGKQLVFKDSLEKRKENPKSGNESVGDRDR